MAPTLVFQSAMESYHNIHAPPPSCNTSPLFQMPNVFVIPPEEDQFHTPPWCYFDAAHTVQPDLSTPPDFGSLDAALNMLRQAEHNTPEFRQSTGGESFMSRKWERPSGTENILGSTPERSETTQRAETGNDSEIVEVVKVRKSDVLSETSVAGATAMKRSRTFKARASRAFKSIKNVGKGTRRKPSVKEIWPSTRSLHSMESQQTLRQIEEPLPPPPPVRQRTLPRRASITLSHLFQSPKSISTSDLFPSALPSEPMLRPASVTESYVNYNGTDMSPPIVERAADGSERDEVERSASPCPSTTKSFRQRFSILDLHRLFSFVQSSSVEKPSPSLPPPCAETISTSFNTTSSMSHGPSTISSSNDAPDIPMDGMCHISDLDSGKPAAGLRNPPGYSDGLRTLRDVSFEMRLDSLHFDSLSFDADNF